ncbi:UPF0715 family protein [Bacillus sp. T17B1]|uniref:UPF0715 family protein n=1 Tax=Bacillus sp. T17B1 TaxID=2918911 RepID=UPI002281102B|nr:UPF0715 family protein [Bacillus sp. T17B1]
MKKTVRSLWTILISSLTLGIIQYFFVGLYSAVFLIVVFAFYFFIPLLIFAFPLQYKLNKKPRKFSIIYLLYYLLLSFIANLVVFYISLSPVYPPIITRHELYMYTGVSAVVYWFWDSIFAQKNI